MPKTLILGAGPAGLYFAYLLKRQTPQAQIRVLEQNAADATFGFGVVFSDRALDFLRDNDTQTHAAIVPAMQTWSDLTVIHRGERITIDGVGFAAIGRLHLLQLLQQRLRDVDITPEYAHTVIDARELDGYDLVVASDGANSFVRRLQAERFGTRIEPLQNKFVWYGTRKRFDTLSQTFIETSIDGGVGFFNAHHYPYSATMSTFIVECDPVTWQRAGFAGMDEAATRACCERVFADTLGGESLVTNKSTWRNFPKVSNAHWSVDNRVLIGDALRTAHFSIGSGTRLALEDAVALAKAMAAHAADVPEALAAFEAARRPIVDKMFAAANASANWYEHFTEHMQLAPLDLAWNYIQRSGRIDVEKLRRISPKFVANHDAHVAAAAAPDPAQISRTSS